MQSVVDCGNRAEVLIEVCVRSVTLLWTLAGGGVGTERGGVGGASIDKVVADMLGDSLAMV